LEEVLAMKLLMQPQQYDVIVMSGKASTTEMSDAIVRVM
jgi:hypothetical protein